MTNSSESALGTMPAASLPKPERRRGGMRIGRLLAQNSMWLVLVALLLLMSAVSESFRNPVNLQNILSQNAIIGIAALGMLVIMVGGNFDLAIGATGGAVSIVTAALSTVVGLPLAILVGILLGLAIGIINGVVVTRLGINSFIATFAIASIITGILFVQTQARSVVGSIDFLNGIAYGAVGPVPGLFVAFIVFALITQVLLRWTKWGQWIYAVGSNAEASYLSGVPVTLVKVGSFVFGGLAIGIAGVLLLGQTGIGQAASASDWPLQAIAICVIGGTSLSGGVGRVSNTIAAVLVLGVVANALNQLGVSPYWQPAVTGFIILVAVVLDRLTHRRGRAA